MVDNAKSPKMLLAMKEALENAGVQVKEEDMKSKSGYVIIMIVPNYELHTYYGPFQTEDEAKNYLFAHVLSVMKKEQKKLKSLNSKRYRVPVHAFITYVNYDPAAATLYTVEDD